MNEELQERIFGHLRANDALMASELAAALNSTVEEVRDQLRYLIVARRVQRMHCGHGILRYRAMSDRARYHDCVTREVKPSAHQPQRPRRIGGIDIETVLADIDVLASEPDAGKRLVQLELIGARVAEHIGNATIDAQFARVANFGDR